VARRVGEEGECCVRQRARTGETIGGGVSEALVAKKRRRHSRFIIKKQKA